MEKNFWYGKRVFITGHTGFKGSWLSLYLQHLNAKVIGFALPPPTDSSLFIEANVAHSMVSIFGDILDGKDLKKAIQTAQPDIVIHMAAESLVRSSYINPHKTYMTNVIGCVNLFEAVRQTDSIRAVINVTSDKCYENNEQLKGYSETDALGGYDPYSSSKACAELVTASYRNSYFHVDCYNEHGVALASVRAGNVIGGGDWAKDRLIPDIIRAIQQGKPVKIRNPNSIRPWQHVLEPLKGYLMLAKKLYTTGKEFSGAWNFGASDEDARSVEWVVQKMIRLWGDGSCWELEKTKHLHEANCLTLNCSKANESLSWSPCLSLGQSIALVVAWHKKQFQGNSCMRKFTIRQITSFLSQNVEQTVEY